MFGIAELTDSRLIPLQEQEWGHLFRGGGPFCFLGAVWQDLVASAHTAVVQRSVDLPGYSSSGFSGPYRTAAERVAHKQRYSVAH